MPQFKSSEKLSRKDVANIKLEAKKTVGEIEKLAARVPKNKPLSLSVADDLVQRAKGLLEKLDKTDDPDYVVGYKRRIDKTLADMQTLVPHKTLAGSLTEEISKESGILTKDDALKLAVGKIDKIKEMEKKVKSFNASKAAALVEEANVTLDALEKVTGTDEKPLRLALVLINGIHTNMSVLVAQKEPRTDFSSGPPRDLQ